MVRGQFPDLFAARLAYLREIIKHWYEAPAQTYPEVFGVMDSNRMFEDLTGVTGFGLFSQQLEGAAVDYDAILDAYDKRFTHLKYGKGFQISEDANDDDVDGAITNLAPALGIAADQSVETVAWNVFNNGFSSETTPDGVSLFNSAHVLRGGGTQSNLVTGDLSVANLETAVNLLDAMKDERSNVINMTPSLLVIPAGSNGLRWVAHEILRSELRSDTANNATNAFNQLGLRILPVKYLTNAPDWFLGVEPARSKLRFFWRKRPVTDFAMDFDTGNFKTKMTMRYSVGAADYRGWVGGNA